MHLHISCYSQIQSTMKYHTLTVIGLVLTINSARLLADDKEFMPTPALVELEKSYAQDKANPQFLARRCHLYAMLGKKKQAQEDIDRFMALPEPLRGNMSSIGWSCFMMDDFPQALKAWKKAIQIPLRTNEKDWYSEYCLSLGYWGVGEFANSAFWYQKAVDKDNSFSRKEDLIKRVAEWNDKEQKAIHQIYDIWRKTYQRRDN